MDDPMLMAGLVAASFLAACMQAATGFGYAVLAVPIYLLMLPAREAVQINVLLSCIVMAVMTAGLWRHAPWRLILRVAAGSVLGVPLGLYFLAQAPDRVVKIAVGLVLAFFLGFILYRRRAKPVRADDRPPDRPLAEGVTGFFGGALGAGIGMPGPPLLVYFGIAGGGKNIVRPAIMAYLLLAFIGIAALNQAGVGYDPQVLRVTLWLIPPVLLGCACGAWGARHIDQKRFDWVTLGALSITAASMLVAVVRG